MFPTKGKHTHFRGHKLRHERSLYFTWMNCAMYFARLELGPQQKQNRFCLVSGKQRDPKKAKNKMLTKRSRVRDNIKANTRRLLPRRCRQFPSPADSWLWTTYPFGVEQNQPSPSLLRCCEGVDCLAQKMVPKRRVLQFIPWLGRQRCLMNSGAPEFFPLNFHRVFSPRDRKKGYWATSVRPIGGHLFLSHGRSLAETSTFRVICHTSL